MLVKMIPPYLTTEDCLNIYIYLLIKYKQLFFKLTLKIDKKIRN